MDFELQILHLEDNRFDSELVARTLASGGIQCNLARVAQPAEFEDLLRNRHFDLAICDYNVPGFDGFSALQRIRTSAPEMPIILLSGALGEEQAIECLKNGATDYILKDRLHRLVPAVKRALAEAELQREHARAYRALRENEERLSCVLLATNDAVYDYDLRSEQIWWNRGLQILFGHNPRAPDNPADIHWWESQIYPEDRPRVVEELHKAFDHLAANTWESEYRFYCADSSLAWVYDRGYILRDSDGKAYRMVGAMMDISEKKRLESDFLRTQRLETIGSIAGGVAHDLNNMLSPILVASELLADYATQPEAKPFLEMIRTSVQRGADLVRQILGFASGVSGERVPVDMKIFGKEALRLIRTSFPKNIEVELSIAPGLPPVRANSTHLHQLLLNLCVNARDAMPNGGKLTIQFREEQLGVIPGSGKVLPFPKKFVKLSVIDTGTGIPDENLKKIFQPFFTTKSAGHGTGLGLATVKQITDSHEGYIRLESTLGQGTTFHVYLPADEQAAAQRVPPSPEAVLRGEGELILFVEDEASLRQLARLALETHNYRVLSASNAEEAFTLFRDHMPEIAAVVADWQMPGMDGVQLLRRLRQEKPTLKIICTTGSTHDRWPSEGEEKVLDVLLRKPYATSELVGALRTAIHAGNAETSASHLPHSLNQD